MNNNMGHITQCDYFLTLSQRWRTMCRKTKCPHASVASEITFSSNNLKWLEIFIVYMTFSVSHTIVEVFQSMLQSFLFTELCRHLFAHSSLKVPPHFNYFKIWALTGHLQHLDYFLFQSFCCKFAALLQWPQWPMTCCHDPSFSPALAVRQMAS